MLATAAVRVVVNAIATMILYKLLDLLLARLLCVRFTPKEPLKELDPLEDPVRPFADCLGRGLCCRLHRNLYFMLLFPLITLPAERSIIAVEGETVKWGYQELHFESQRFASIPIICNSSASGKNEANTKRG